MQINKIYNIDCFEGMKRIENKSVDLVLTDIPYGECNGRDNEGIRKINKGDADIVSFEIPNLVSELSRVCCNLYFFFTIYYGVFTDDGGRRSVGYCGIFQTLKGAYYVRILRRQKACTRKLRLLYGWFNSFYPYCKTKIWPLSFYFNLGKVWKKPKVYKNPILPDVWSQTKQITASDGKGKQK